MHVLSSQTLPYVFCFCCSLCFPIPLSVLVFSLDSIVDTRTFVCIVYCSLPRKFLDHCFSKPIHTRWVVVLSTNLCTSIYQIPSCRCAFPDKALSVTSYLLPNHYSSAWWSTIFLLSTSYYFFAASIPDKDNLPAVSCPAIMTCGHIPFPLHLLVPFPNYKISLRITLLYCSLYITIKNIFYSFVII